MLIPRPYQVEGIDLLRKNKRFALWDDPGLGKTLQAIVAAHPPVLVACPTYLIFQWQDVINVQFPDAIVSVASGTRSEREAALRVVADWYVINTEMLRTFKLPKVTTVIFDEAHHLRNRQSMQSKAAFNIAKSTEYVFELTATPVMKDPDDIFQQLRILDSLTFKTYWGFVYEYCKISQTPFGARVVGISNAHKFKVLLSKYGIKRTYSEVGQFLPDIIEQTIKIDLPPDSRKEYDDIKKYYREKVNGKIVTLTSAMAVIQALRRATLCEDKYIASAVVSRLDTGSVIFCWYRDTAQAIGELLECPVITGDLPALERARIATSNKLIVATIASLSEGVDLSHLRNVVFVEQDWIPGSNYQALSRIRRGGVNRAPVLCYYMVVRKSIDEVINNASTRRKQTAQQIMKGALSG